ncbi:GerMN domain-containing protein [bacterium]|nr:GerMN domain-containing protein [bacterium]
MKKTIPKKTVTKKPQAGKNRSLVFVMVLIAAFAVSTGFGYLYFRDVFEIEMGVRADSFGQSSKTPEKPSGNGRLYVERKSALDDEDRTGMRKDDLLVAAEDIIRKQMKPYSVNLLDLYLDSKGTLYIDLDENLGKNFRGSAYDELRLIAELCKSMKSAIPGFSAVRILIDGRSVETFGGHIDISRAIGVEIAEYF